MGLSDELCVDEDKDNKVVEDEFTPREYQTHVLELCLKQNSIVFLPTGSGKTYIAVMLIKRMAADVEVPFSAGGKRSFFLVNTVALAEQQKEYISRHTHLKVGHYTGDMNVDYWTQSIWFEELEKHQILVMTGQIFLDILRHKYITLGRANLIVFDECHHAVNDHCMSKIMEQFDVSPPENHPRVLGLTATLLNSSCKLQRVQEYVNDLQKRFRSKIATVENLGQVESFSTSPTENMVIYDIQEALPAAQLSLKILTRTVDFVSSLEFEEDRVAIDPIPNAVYQRGKKLGKKLSNLLADVKYHIESLGIYGGNLAAIKLAMKLERFKQKAEFELSLMVYQALLTTLTMIRKIFDDAMGGVPEEVRIMRYSSTQILTLFEILKEYKCEDNERGIIFVERRVTAKVLYSILKAASENIKEYNFIDPDFVVGFNSNPFSRTRESTLENKWNREALEKFQKGIKNILVASNVLEEGIDIPQCNLVVKFDVPPTYRSYIQSKGRARRKSSRYVLMVPRPKRDLYRNAFIEYRKIESLLKMILQGNLILNDDDNDDDDDDDDRDVDVHYTTSINACVSSSSAIPLVNRYCASLPHDKFTSLAPNWFLMDNTRPKFQCILLLPINSVLKEPIQGEKKSSKKNAKRSAAFQACVKLHQLGELNENLLPVGQNTEGMIDESELFSIYAEAAEVETCEQPGTKKSRRQYEKQVPQALFACSPKEGIDLYLHVMEVTPAYTKPPEDDCRKHCFYSLLNSRRGYAILSSQKLPQLCDFSIFMNVGKIDCKFHINHRTIRLSNGEIERLHHFHSLLFFDLLKLNKPYMVRNLENTENTFLIVPVEKDLLGDFSIDWDVVSAYKDLPPVVEPKDENLRLGIKEENWDKYQHKIVAPWYRGMLPDQVYVVTQICRDMGPLSSFPTAAYSTYEEYFFRKYCLTLKNSEQPLFEVKAINNRFNCLKPRNVSGTGRNKRQEQNEDFEEHLVPELCGEVNFLADLWVKAVCLPSCLHRIHYLLLADELRRDIATALSFTIDPEEPWEPIQLENSCLNEDLGKAKPVQSTTSAAPAFKGFSILASEVALLGPENEPVDIERENAENVTLMDLLYFEEYINKPLEGPARPRSSLSETGSEQENEMIQVVSSPRADTDVPVPEINLLGVKAQGGPQLMYILQALTCAGANDALNMERLETLGDSFLKFVTSVFLFARYPKLDEGKLTRVKGKIIGNRNLFYCGRKINIPGKLKIHEFSPKSDWIPPRFCVPPTLKKAVKDSKLCPSVLFDVFFPRAEQNSGCISASSESFWREIIHESEAQTSTNVSPSESLIGLQTVPDKAVADCVEALIGTYLLGSGIEGALRVVGWLGVLPRSYTELRGHEEYSCSAYVVTDGDIQSKVEYYLPTFEAEDLEERLGYTFRDKGYLLQALSHASFMRNRVTECYQRLEFLGDAILDFLITCHIYEKCGNLSPGELTDLRSALVNNITFGSLAVRYGFQKFARYDSSKLFEKIDTFVKFQQNNNHKIDQELLLLLGENEATDEAVGEYVDVPKVLGDLFESMAGAIYLDSGKSLETVWQVYYRLMRNEIEKFSKNIPKQPVRMLYEKANPPPVFQPAHALGDLNKVMVELEVVINHKKCRYYGVGENKADAKRAAAKLALRDL